MRLLRLCTLFLVLASFAATGNIAFGAPGKNSEAIRAEYVGRVAVAIAPIRFEGGAGSALPNTIFLMLDALEKKSGSGNISIPKTDRAAFAAWRMYFHAARVALDRIETDPSMKKDHAAFLSWISYNETLARSLAADTSSGQPVSLIRKTYLSEYQNRREVLTKNFGAYLSGYSPQINVEPTRSFEWPLRRARAMMLHLGGVLPFGGKIDSVGDCDNGKVISVTMPKIPMSTQKFLVPLLVSLLDPQNDLRTGAWVLGAAWNVPGVCMGGNMGTVGEFLQPADGIAFIIGARGGSDEQNQNPPGGGLGGGEEDKPGAPIAITGSATVGGGDRNGLSATVQGQVGPNGNPTTYWAEYGLFGPGENKTPVRDGGTGKRVFGVTITLSGLDSGQKYYYRIVAKNIKGTTRGETKTFSTVGR